MKKTMRKLLAGFLAAAVAVTCVIPAYASDPSMDQPLPGPSANENVVARPSGGATQTVTTTEEGTATTEEVKSNKKNLTLPKKVEVNGTKYTPTTLGANAFKESPKTQNVVIPSTYTDIGSKAFAGSNLKSVTIKGNSKKATTLGKNIMKGSKVTSVTAGTKKSQVKLAKGVLNGAKKNVSVTFNAKTSSQVKVAKNAFKGTNTKKMTINAGNMSKSEFQKFKKKMEKAGFKGKITRKKK